jgi:enamine deaminase RidA (YjgF/YER057c/UK114 family)
MSKLQYFNYPGYGEMANENGYHYSQAVRVGNEVKISGQGTFVNIHVFAQS